MDSLTSHNGAGLIRRLSGGGTRGPDTTVASISAHDRFNAKDRFRAAQIAGQNQAAFMALHFLRWEVGLKVGVSVLRVQDLGMPAEDSVVLVEYEGCR